MAERLLQHEGEIQGPVQKLTLELAHGHGDELQGHPGVQGRKGAQDRRQAVGTDRLGRGEPHQRCVRLVLHGDPGLLHEGQQALGIVQEPVSLPGQFEPVADPAEQGHSQVVLQVLHLGGDARLGIVQLPRRAGEAEGAGGGAEGGEGARVHGGYYRIFRLKRSVQIVCFD